MKFQKTAMMFAALAVSASASAFAADSLIFEPTSESLSQFQVPEWFENAKFGIFTHWGPQCQPESGDWYARNMYIRGDGKFNTHLRKYGPQKDFGFKDIIHEWHADKWDPDYLVSLYRRMGARYVVSLANHHDNFDLWDSPYQPWNSVNLGPKRDILKGWKEACDKYGLHWGVSIHASHACEWYEPSREYDGLLTLKDGGGTWWGKMGLDPQDLYEQRHEPSRNNREWDWKPGVVTPPTLDYRRKFMNRHKQLIDDYKPEILYFDDTYLPFYPVNNDGMELVAYYYNEMLKKNNGKQEVVVTGKVLNEQQRKTIVWDVERGVPSSVITPHWQTDTCIGDWHYERETYNNNRFKSPATVINMLVDIVSKGGNLLLSVPIRGNGTIDEKELAVCEGIGDWMAINSEGIYDTKVWKKFGEGPQSEENIGLNAQGFNEGRGKAASAQDFRFTVKDKTVYAFTRQMPKPGDELALKSFADEKVKNVTLLGSQEQLNWKMDGGLLKFNVPQNNLKIALCFKIELQ